MMLEIRQKKVFKILNVPFLSLQTIIHDITHGPVKSPEICHSILRVVHYYDKVSFVMIFKRLIKNIIIILFISKLRNLIKET